VSEYQYYEFLATDRPLDDAMRAEVRSLSTRARITATSFVNEYHWGDFKGDPSRLMERYYDAHLYVANWGTRRVMFRLPCDLLDPDVVEDYCVGDQLRAWATDDEYIVVDVTSEDDAGEFDFDDDAATLLSAIIGVRAELAAGDLRPLYLAWLAAYGTGEPDQDVFGRDADLEPPVPPGLGALTAAQRALADFLRLDDDLITIAAQAASARRTVADLFDNAARRRADHECRLAAQRADDEARQEQARRHAREQRLDTLADEEDVAWSRVEAMIATRKPAEYDAALTLLTDLQTLAEREDRYDTFTLRTIALRQRHGRKAALLERLNRAGI
jgi:hypothetical protein